MNTPALGDFVDLLSK